MKKYIINCEAIIHNVAKIVRTLVPSFLSTIPIKEGKVLKTKIPDGATKKSCINEISSLLSFL